MKAGETVGLGDAIKKATSSFGVRPCAGCERRAASLNRFLSFSGANPTAAAAGSPLVRTVSQFVCNEVRIRVCSAFAAIMQVICDATVAITQFICTLFGTVAQTICDATETISQTICDLTTTVSNTICDVTQSVCNTICDATSWIPLLGDLICEASHVVCSTICTASHIVSEVICTASHIVSTFVCTISHVLTSLVCLAGKVLSYLVCLVSHIVSTIVCILWSIAVALVCIPIRIWQWLLCQIRRLLRALFGHGARRPRIEHVFVLMLENRSFDHMLGFSGIAGGIAPGSHSNPDPNAGGVPVFAATPASFFLTKQDTDPPHEFDYVLTQLTFDPNTGTTPPYNPSTGYPPLTNAGFVAAYEQTDSSAHPNASANPHQTMHCYDPTQLPVLTALAHEFAVCNRWFSSLPGPTWPNRFFAHAASSGGLDDSPNGFQTVTATLVDGYGFEHGTIFDALDDACIEWRVFHGDALPQVFAINGMTLNRALGKFRSFDEFAEEVNEAGYSAAYTFIEPDYGNVLPVISDADFTCGNSQHPLDDVTRGERLIKNVYETIRNSPHWNNSVLIVTYDEHGGFFDHEPPPIAVPPGDAISDPANDHHGFKFDRLGVRVPAVIISPLIPQGVVDSTKTYDHSSIPATLERLFGLSPLTDRDAAANDILHLFTLPAPRTNTPTVLPDPAVSGFECKDDD